MVETKHGARVLAGTVAGGAAAFAMLLKIIAGGLPLSTPGVGRGGGGKKDDKKKKGRGEDGADGDKKAKKGK